MLGVGPSQGLGKCIISFVFGYWVGVGKVICRAVGVASVSGPSWVALRRDFFFIEFHVCVGV